MSKDAYSYEALVASFWKDNTGSWPKFLTSVGIGLRKDKHLFSKTIPGRQSCYHREYVQSNAIECNYFPRGTTSRWFKTTYSPMYKYLRSHLVLQELLLHPENIYINHFFYQKPHPRCFWSREEAGASLEPHFFFVPDFCWWNCHPKRNSPTLMWLIWPQNFGHHFSCGQGMWRWERALWVPCCDYLTIQVCEREDT